LATEVPTAQSFERIRDEAIQAAEIQTAPTHPLVDEVMSLSRKPHAKDQLTGLLNAIQSDAHTGGRREEAKLAVGMLQQERLNTAENAVCGFIAEVQALVRSQGIPTGTLTLSTFVVEKIIEVLQRAGFTAQGRTNVGRITENRDSIMNKNPSDVRAPRYEVTPRVR
jgi:hypothetical protein